MITPKHLFGGYSASIMIHQDNTEVHKYNGSNAVSVIQSFINVAKPYARYKKAVRGLEKARDALETFSNTAPILSKTKIINEDRKRELIKHATEAHNDTRSWDLSNGRDCSIILQIAYQHLKYIFARSAVAHPVRPIFDDFQRMCDTTKVQTKSEKARTHEDIKSKLDEIGSSIQRFRAGKRGWVLEEGFINIADELKYDGNYKFLEEGEIAKSWKEAEAARIMYTHLVTAFENIRRADGLSDQGKSGSFRSAWSRFSCLPNVW
jgi:hypothetical protein